MITSDRNMLEPWNFTKSCHMTKIFQLRHYDVIVTSWRQKYRHYVGFFIFGWFCTPLMLEPKKIVEIIKSPLVSCFWVLKLLITAKTTFFSHITKYKNFKNFVNFGASLRSSSFHMRRKITFFRYYSPLSFKNNLQNTICIIKAILMANPKGP